MAKASPTVTGTSADVHPEAPVCVLTKVGEASLKGRNRRHFLEVLRRNLKAALAGVDARVQSGGSVLVIPVNDELAADEVASRIEMPDRTPRALGRLPPAPPRHEGGSED